MSLPDSLSLRDAAGAPVVDEPRSGAVQQRVESQQQALLGVAQSGLLTGNFPVACQYLTRCTAEALGVERASIWLMTEDRQSLILQDLYQRSNGSHTTGQVLRQADYPKYFAALDASRAISARDAGTDPRTSEFKSTYLDVLNIRSMLDAVLWHQGQSYGVVCVESVGDERDWQPDEQQFAASIADLAAVAFESEQTRQAQSRLKASEERFSTTFRLNADSMVLVRMTDNGIVEVNRKFERQTGYSASEVKGKPITSLNLWVNPAEMDVWNQEIASKGVVQDLEATLRMRDGSPRLLRLSSEKVEIDGEYFVLTSARDITEARRQERIVQDVSASMAGATGDGFFRTLVEQLARSLDADMAMVGELNPEHSGYVRTVAVQSSGQEAPNFTYPLQGSPCTEVLGSGICIFPNGVADQFPEDRPLKERGMQAYVGAPLLDSSGHAMGLMAVLFKRPLENSELAESLLRIFAIRAAAELERLNQLKELEHRASHDLLTGLPNRLRLERHIAEHITKASATPGALMLIDLDRFKEINDTLGHALGDALLARMARRLQLEMQVVYGGVVARLGGDEFGIWLPEALNEEEAETAARRAQDAITAPFDISGYHLEVGASIGIVLFPRHGNSATELFRRADIAMYVAKRTGDGFAFYEPSQDPYSPERLGLMGQLSGAVRAGQFELHYQPRFNISDVRVTGFEALVRWRHPELGMVPPSQFIPLAEVSDAIRPLTLWIFEAALKQQARWRAEGHTVLVAINLSPRVLMDRSCPDQIEALLEKHNADPQWVECEVTESSLIVDPSRVAGSLLRLHAMGLKIAIDDFGTGYSSLSHLKRLPLHALKIDVSFVTHMIHNEQDAAIVASTIALAHNLGLEVVAEGIEDEATLQRLRELGCDEGQGYFIGRPVPAEEAAQWLTAKP